VPYKIHTILTDNGIQFCSAAGHLAEFWVLLADVRICGKFRRQRRRTSFLALLEPMIRFGVAMSRT